MGRIRNPRLRPAVVTERSSRTRHGNIRVALAAPAHPCAPRHSCIPARQKPRIATAPPMWCSSPWISWRTSVRHPVGGLWPCKSAVLPICHRPPGGTGAPPTGQPHPLPRGVRPEQPIPRPHHPGWTWPAATSRFKPACARATPSHVLGTAPQARVPDRYRQIGMTADLHSRRLPRSGRA